MNWYDKEIGTPEPKKFDAEKYVAELQPLVIEAGPYKKAVKAPEPSLYDLFVAPVISVAVKGFLVLLLLVGLGVGGYMAYGYVSGVISDISSYIDGDNGGDSDSDQATPTPVDENVADETFVIMKAETAKAYGKLHQDLLDGKINSMKEFFDAGAAYFYDARAIANRDINQILMDGFDKNESGKAVFDKQKALDVTKKIQKLYEVENE